MSCVAVYISGTWQVITNQEGSNLTKPSFSLLAINCKQPPAHHEASRVSLGTFIILRVILNRISYQMLSLRGNRIKFYNKINKVLVYYNIQLCWNVGHPTLSNDTCTNACQFEFFLFFIICP